MAVTHTQNEPITPSEVGKRPSAVFERVKKTKRVVLSSNDRPEAILLPIEDYEALLAEYEELIADLDYLLLACEIAERKARAKGKRIP